MESFSHRAGRRTLVSLFAAVGPEGLRAEPILQRAAGAEVLVLTDLGPALAACALAYATPRARHEATRLLAALRAGFPGELLLDGPDEAATVLGAEACGCGPLPALVINDGDGRRLSHAAELAIPPELLPAARIVLLGHGRLPAWLALAPADRTAIEARLSCATSLAHAAALAGRSEPLRALGPETLARAERFALGEPALSDGAPPDFLPEEVVASLTPGALPESVALMAQAVLPFLSAPPFCPAPLLPLPRRAAATRAPVPLSLFPDAAAPPARRLRRIS